MTTADIEAAIKKLSEKRHVITENARRAKAELDGLKEDKKPSQKKPSAPQAKASEALDEFNKNITILTSLMRETGLDELVQFVTRPGQILSINFFIGVLRGIGFAVGLVLMTFLVIALLKYSLNINIQLPIPPLSK